MTRRISTVIFASAALVLALAAAPALSAGQPEKEQVASADAGNKADDIRIVAPSHEGGLGTIWFGKTTESRRPAHSFGGPR